MKRGALDIQYVAVRTACHVIVVGHSSWGRLRFFSIIHCVETTKDAEFLEGVEWEVGRRRLWRLVSLPTFKCTHWETKSYNVLVCLFVCLKNSEAFMMRLKPVLPTLGYWCDQKHHINQHLASHRISLHIPNVNRCTHCDSCFTCNFLVCFKMGNT